MRECDVLLVLGPVGESDRGCLVLRYGWVLFLSSSGRVMTCVDKMA